MRNSDSNDDDTDEIKKLKPTLDQLEKVEDVPKQILCKYKYKPNIDETSVDIIVEEGTDLPSGWSELIQKLAKGQNSSDQQSQLNEIEERLYNKLLATAPPANVNRPITAAPSLTRPIVRIRYKSSKSKKS